MERRRETRFTVEQAVTVTVLGEVDRQLTATVKDVSGRGLRLNSPVEVPTGSSLKIELQDAIALGEAAYCRREGDHFAVGVQLEEILCGLLHLATALGDIADDPTAGAAGGPLGAAQARPAENPQR